MNNDKLSKLQTTVRIGGKGTPRRKMKKTHKTNVVGGDDKKLQTVLKKMGTQNISEIEEVNMFKDDGNIIHFDKPKVSASIASNTFIIDGKGEDKELFELVPGIINQLGPESIASLKKLAEAAQSEAAAAGEAPAAEEDNDDEIPELVENFDEVENKA
ncbi:nascent polypeptide-associated complex subunit beta [Piromyces finnis]|uniref:Nascent polypeptide-associated complex subunit beta n=1 Tax=Piromyces finnis TaxID=1754191 RepID=A0A1Y1V8S6_9FUNG|nr:nascent polypeptide-associated complex subunit beta [Piromyces finnis]|eukprot:ORX49987.1 nascent polypeptide-associated complex subunit beta [Piromyces finnis]